MLRHRICRGTKENLNFGNYPYRAIKGDTRSLHKVMPWGGYIEKLTPYAANDISHKASVMDSVGFGFRGV